MELLLKKDDPRNMIDYDYENFGLEQEYYNVEIPEKKVERIICRRRVYLVCEYKEGQEILSKDKCHRCGRNIKVSSKVNLRKYDNCKLYDEENKIIYNINILTCC